MQFKFTELLILAITFTADTKWKNQAALTVEIELPEKVPANNPVFMIVQDGKVESTCYNPIG